MRIQASLFPWLQEELGPLSEKQQQLVTVLEFARVEDFVRNYYGCVGAPAVDRQALARAFVAKAVYNISTNSHLRDRLLCDKVLRRICGFDSKGEVPSESTFSRAFAEFSESALPNRIHEALIEKYHSEHLVGHISRDSTAVEAREKVCDEAKEKAKKKKVAETAKKAQGKAKRGRPKRGEERTPKEIEITRLERQKTMTLKEMLTDLPTGCDVGTKRNSKGCQISWKGYKLHIDTADGAIPISFILTSASVHDSQAALPLATLTAQRVINCYDLMDAAYDSEIIREHSSSLGHVALIDFNHRSPNDTREFAPHEAQRYNERSTAERVNARLKDEFGARVIFVRGPQKIMTHLAFGLIALTVDQLMRVVT
ncbi:MAG: transposase [Alphaproteobacteria bacterium]|nr:transposase [Alphaproteobacteria bacterium]